MHAVHAALAAISRTAPERRGPRSLSWHDPDDVEVLDPLLRRKAALEIGQVDDGESFGVATRFEREHLERGREIGAAAPDDRDLLKEQLRLA